MQVILLERVEKLGLIGDVVTVKDGFARNFLLPRGKALRANEANKKKFEANRAQIEAENAKRREAAQKDSKGLEGKRSEEHTSELQSLIRNSDAVLRLQKK